MLTRRIASKIAESKTSILLLGPRQVGKSTLIRELRPDVAINLAHEPTYLEFVRNPRELDERLGALKPSAPLTVFIDEVQRLPSLLNTIQAILDDQSRQLRFLLTGSSARKLKRGKANLLPGRIHTYNLGPVVASEVDYALDLNEALATGTLPGVLCDESSAAKKKTLRSYTATYLREEIQAEALTRNIEGFSRALTIAGEWSGKHIDLAKIAQAAAVSRQSLGRWFEVVEDTLIAVRIDSFAKSLTRRLVQHPKYYFFDVGVLNGILSNFNASADRRGVLFEHLICGQLVHSAAAWDADIRLFSWRTEAGAEVDFVLDHDSRIWAIELKAGDHVSSSDTSGLKRFGGYVGKNHQARIWYCGKHRRIVNGVDVLPWQEGLKELGF